MCQYQRRLRPQAFDQRSHQVAFTDSGVALYMQVLVQVGSKSSDQMILCTAQPALIITKGNHLPLEGMMMADVAILIFDIPPAAGQ
ncbi:hypothetical protein D9M69_548430 [compost metagenome]